MNQNQNTIKSYELLGNTFIGIRLTRQIVTITGCPLRVKNIC